MEVTTRYLHGKHGVEIRMMSLSRDNTDSWVTISHGSNKFVMVLKTVRMRHTICPHMYTARLVPSVFKSAR